MMVVTHFEKKPNLLTFCGSQIVDNCLESIVAENSQQCKNVNFITI